MSLMVALGKSTCGSLLKDSGVRVNAYYADRTLISPRNWLLRSTFSRFLASFALVSTSKTSFISKRGFLTRSTVRSGVSSVQTKIYWSFLKMFGASGKTSKDYTMRFLSHKWRS